MKFHYNSAVPHRNRRNNERCREVPMKIEFPQGHHSLGIQQNMAEPDDDDEEPGQANRNTPVIVWADPAGTSSPRESGLESLGTAFKYATGASILVSALLLSIAIRELENQHPADSDLVVQTGSPRTLWMSMLLLGSLCKSGCAVAFLKRQARLLLPLFGATIVIIALSLAWAQSPLHLLVVLLDSLWAVFCRKCSNLLVGQWFTASR